MLGSGQVANETKWNIKATGDLEQKPTLKPSFQWLTLISKHK